MDQLRAAAARSETSTSAPGLYTTPATVTSLSFEAGFGSLEQRMLVESIALEVERVSRMILKAGIVQVPLVRCLARNGSGQECPAQIMLWLP